MSDELKGLAFELIHKRQIGMGITNDEITLAKGYLEQDKRIKELVEENERLKELLGRYVKDSNEKP